MGWRVWALSAALALTAGASRAESASFGDWTVVCDNVRNCTAFGFSSEAQDDVAYLRVARRAGPGAAPTLALSIYDPPAGVWSLDVDGRAVGAVTPVAEGKDDAYPTARLSPATTRALVAAIRSGHALTVNAGGKAVAVSLAGSSAALRWMDAQQRRAGTAEALAAAGKAKGPGSAPRPPLVRAAAPVSQAGLPAAVPKSVQAQLKDCDDDIGELGFDPTIARLSKGMLLWSVACSRGAYNVVYSLFVSDEAGGGVRPARIPYASGEMVASLMNVDFDPATQTLSNFDKGRGLGDCGAFTDWVWDGKAFRLSGQTLMPECRGVTGDDWPTSYVTRRR